MLGSAVTGIVTIAGEHVKSAKKGEKVGLEISSKTGRAVQKGGELYLTTDTQLLDTLQKTKLKTLPVSLKVKAREGERFTVEIREEGGKSSKLNAGITEEVGDSSRREGTASQEFTDKTSVEFADEYIVQGAEKAPTTAEQIEKAMGSLGDTPFEASSIAIEADENIFIPVGVLKNARRKAADLLLEKILKGHKKDQKYPLLGNFNELCAPEKCVPENGENKSSENTSSENTSGENTSSENKSSENNSTGKREKNTEAGRKGSIASERLLLSVEVNEFTRCSTLQVQVRILFTFRFQGLKS